MTQNKDELYKIGCEYMYKDQYREAIKTFEDVLRLDSRNSNASNKLAEAHYKLGNHYMYKNQYREAIESFEDALKIDSRNSNVISKLAEAKSKLNK